LPTTPPMNSGSSVRLGRVRLRVPDRRLVIGTLVLADALLVLLYLLSQRIFVGRHPALAHMFDLDGEGNAAAWFASSQLLLVAALSLLCALQVDDRALRHFYYLLGAAFVFFSADEAAMIHEPLTFFLRAYSVTTPLPGPDHVTWMFPYVAVMVVLFILMRKGLVPFLRFSTGRLAFLVGAALFVLGGMVVEVVGYYILVHFAIDYYGRGGTLQVVLEESCELLGVTLMACGLLTRLYGFEPTQAGTSPAPRSPAA